MRKSHKLKLEKIPEFVKSFAKTLKGGEVIALIGPLGAGKTTFTKALGVELDVKKVMPSPSYVLLYEYAAKVKNTPITLYHLDIYRTNTPQEVSDLGVTEFWQNPQTIVIIEWAEKIQKLLPKDTIYIYFQ